MNKIIKKFLKIVSIFLFLSLFLSIQVHASSYNLVYLGGHSIGIKMNTGVYVVGKYDVPTTSGKISPWEHVNIEVGDKIEKINGITVENNTQLLEYLSHCDSSTVKLLINRNNDVFKEQIKVVKNLENESSIGLYIKDQIQGIGTLTFVTNDGHFASLGHGVYENKQLINNINGKLYFSTVSSIIPSEPGNAGEKRASINTVEIGKLIQNDITGLYGTINLDKVSKNEVEISNQKDIVTGPAQIYTTLTDNTIKGYDIDIISVNIQSKKAVKGIKFKVVDDELLSKTGGIVQGMSGSPIVQNGKIIGAVSHVTVENPVYGYGMHINFMIEEINDIA